MFGGNAAVSASADVVYPVGGGIVADVAATRANARSAGPGEGALARLMVRPGGSMSIVSSGGRLHTSTLSVPVPNPPRFSRPVTSARPATLLAIRARKNGKLLRNAVGLDDVLRSIVYVRFVVSGPSRSFTSAWALRHVGVVSIGAKAPRSRC